MATRRRRRGLFRRRLLIGTAGVVGAGLTVGFGYLASVDVEDLEPRPFEGNRAQLNAWITLYADGRVHFAVPRLDMGQGASTGCAMLLAEELGLEWDPDLIEVSHPSEPLPVYANFALATNERTERLDDPFGWVAKRALGALPFIVTGGSTTIIDGWDRLRLAGATARELLRAAAAERWGVAPADCRVASSTIIHDATDRRALFGQLVEDAARQQPRDDVRLTPDSRLRLVGRSLPHLDVAAKSSGRTRYGIDVQLDGMLYAAVRPAPMPFARIDTFDSAAIEALPNVVKAVDLGNALGVVARSWWHARQAANAAEVTFTDGEHPDAPDESPLGFSSERLHELTAARLADGELAFEGAEIDVRYATPLLSHACLEPMNCTARVDADGRAEVWTGTQSPTITRFGAKRGASLRGDVAVEVPAAGGGFGGRTESDVSRMAVQLAAAVPGSPVKLLLDREADIALDAFRPAVHCRARARFDGAGNLAEIGLSIAGQSVARSFGQRNMPFPAPSGDSDPLLGEGATGLPYAASSHRTETLGVDAPVPVGYWRSVGHSHNAFFVESFIDECASRHGRDPLEYRLSALASKPRHRAVLETVATLTGYEFRARDASFVGLALHESFRSIVAQAVRVKVDADRRISILRIDCVADCGRLVNPDAVRAQMEGGIYFALTAAMFGAVTMAGGAIEQRNFDSYPLLRMHEAPPVRVELVDSRHAPGGAGEPGVPPLAPALANAVFAATGTRVRTLPLSEAGFSLAATA